MVRMHAVSGCWYVAMLPTTGVDAETVGGGAGLYWPGGDWYSTCCTQLSMRIYIVLSVVGGSGGMLPRKFSVCESGILETTITMQKLWQW